MTAATRRGEAIEVTRREETAAATRSGAATAGTAAKPEVARTREELERALGALGRDGRRIGLVPTMGYFHAGHLSLMDRARELADATVVSIFVNPLQFGAGEDLDRYPRNPERDFRLAASRGVGLLFVPEEETIYPGGAPLVRIDPGPLDQRLCGLYRPGHFAGVLTVVCKLFGLIRPELAVFGRKDFQQAVLIRRMVEDLELGVRIEISPLVREVDGLAMSSRNAYLTPKERRQALGLFRSLSAADHAFRAGERRSEELLGRVRETVARHPGLKLQYAEVVDPVTLDPLEAAADRAVLAIAAFSGGTRLIDNLVLGAESPDPRIRSAPARLPAS